MEIICPASYPGIDKLVDAIPVLADQGVTAIEMWVDHPEYFDCGDPRELDALRARLRATGIRVNSIHSPYGPKMDISSLDDQVHESGVEGLIEAIEFAGAVDARTVIVHASDKLDGSTNGRLERARGVLREMSLVAKESGIMLALENLPPNYLGHTPEEILALLDGVDSDSAGICFDSGHANMSGRFAEFTKALLPHAVATHLHDNDGSEDQHRFPGDGTIDWQCFASAYRHCGSGATIMLECKPPEQMPWQEAFRRLRTVLGE